MRKPLLAMDIDNSISNTNGLLSGFLPGLDFNAYPTIGVDGTTFAKNPWLYTDVLPLEGAVEALNFLSNYWEIVYLTANKNGLRE